MKQGMTMLRHAFAAIAALSLAAQPALAQTQSQEPKREHRYNPISRDTLLPLGIILGLTALVIAFTLHTRDKKKPASP
jgi:hypothetical protein